MMVNKLVMALSCLHACCQNLMDGTTAENDTSNQLTFSAVGQRMALIGEHEN